MQRLGGSQQALSLVCVKVTHRFLDLGGFVLVIAVRGVSHWHVVSPQGHG